MVMTVNFCGNYVANVAYVLNMLGAFSDVRRPKMTDLDNVLSLSAVKMKQPMWTNPKIIAFDLDCTLWPFWVDTHVTPPFHLENGIVIDARKRHVNYIPGVPEILKELQKRGIKMAAVSRTGEVAGARQLLKLFDFEKFFSFVEIFPGSKILHFSKIKRETDVEYEEMMFFDDEFRNIKDIKKLGVFTIYCPDGLEARTVDSALIDFDRTKR